ncbi:MAG: hypothetical protein LBC86_00955 [Oscillospiraceae bacterium]|jgi:hypothetical protein|nr:hypothetical protein [Oscillospiraceae bacterium]
MKDILEGLFIQYINVKADDDLMNRAEEIESKLKKSLNQEEKQLLIEYANIHFDSLYRQSMGKFRQGFWLGFEMMRELQESD